MDTRFDDLMTQKLPTVKQKTVREGVSSDIPAATHTIQPSSRRNTPAVLGSSSSFSEDSKKKIHLIEEQCRSFCLSLFFREQNAVHSLGITSSIPGEGKSFVALMMAQVLANDSVRPVMLIECDWENTGPHDYFSFPATPGLAEWLRGECTEEDIKHKVHENLTVVRAGESRQDMVKLLRLIKQRGFRDVLALNNEDLLIDLPPIITTSYSVFAAGLVDALALVVRAGATPDNLIADACAFLKDLPVQGIILNQVEYSSRQYPSVRKSR